MPDFTLLDPETGRILQTGNVPPCDVALQNIRHAPNSDGTFEVIQDGSIIVLEGSFNGRTQYWSDNDIIDRPRVTELTEFTIAADGEALITFPVPPGTTITEYATNLTLVIDDGVFEFATADPGERTFSISPPFPYQHQEIRVVANG